MKPNQESGDSNSQTQGGEMTSRFWAEIKKVVSLIVYTIVCQLSGVGFYFLVTSNNWIEQVVFG